MRGELFWFEIFSFTPARGVPSHGGSLGALREGGQAQSSFHPWPLHGTEPWCSITLCADLGFKNTLRAHLRK